MSALPLDASGRRPAFFSEAGLDQVLSMVLELAAELWVVRERQFLTESLLARTGTDIRAALETYEPTAEEQQILAKMRADMTAQMFRTLNREHRQVSTE